MPFTAKEELNEKIKKLVGKKARLSLRRIEDKQGLRFECVELDKGTDRTNEFRQGYALQQYLQTLPTHAPDHEEDKN